MPLTGDFHYVKGIFVCGVLLQKRSRLKHKVDFMPNKSKISRSNKTLHSHQASTTNFSPSPYI